ncbi:MAG: hypothetical protein AB1847_17790 [bacterium]
MTQVTVQKNSTLIGAAIKNKEIIISFCLFVVLLCLLCFVNNSLEQYSPSTIQMANQATARVVSGILNLIRIESTPSESTINISKGGSLQIIYECTGIYVFLIFTSFVLSYPAFLHQKLLGLATLIPILYLFNISRIVSLAIVQIHWPQYLDMIHKYLWEATFIVLILVMAYLWLLWISGQLRFWRCGKLLKAAAQFVLFSCLGFGLLMLLFRPYLHLLGGMVNTALSLSWKHWLNYWPMRLFIENKDLWLIYSGGKVQIHDAQFLVPNLVPFVSLMLVTRLRPRVKALGVSLGSVILCGYHAFTLILVIQKMAQRWLYLYTFFRVYLLFLLPVILWLPFFLSSRQQRQGGEENVAADGRSGLKILPGRNPARTQKTGAGKTGSEVGSGVKIAGSQIGRAGEAENHTARAGEAGIHTARAVKTGSGCGVARGRGMDTFPGDTAGCKGFYVVLGIILPMVILLFGNTPGPGYYLGFFLWLTGLVLILPQSAFLTGAKGRKRTFGLILLSILFWQGPILANSLMYVPEGKRALLLKSPSQPSSCVDEGFHLGFYLAQKLVLFDLQDRKILIQIGAQVQDEPRPLIAADLEILCHVSKNSNLGRIYLDLGDSKEKVDQALVVMLKQRVGAEIQKYLPRLSTASMDTGRIRAHIMEAVKKSLDPYKIEVTGMKIINKDNPQRIL